MANKVQVKFNALIPLPSLAISTSTGDNAGTIYFTGDGTEDLLNYKIVLNGHDYTGVKQVTSGNIVGTLNVDGTQVPIAGWDSKADVNSPTFTGTPQITTTPASNDNSHKIADTAFVQAAVEAKIATADAMIFKGVLDATHSLPASGYKTGWTYKVAAAGTYAGQVCEIGDMVIAVRDYAQSSASNNDWTVIQNNVDGAVTGPTNATDGNIALFDGTTGKLIKNSTAKPSDFAAANHVHGNITNDGKITASAVTVGTNDRLVIATSTNGVIEKAVAFNTSNPNNFLSLDGTFKTVDISSKANKPSNPTAGHVATLDASGNLTDSGYTIGQNIPSSSSGNVLGTTLQYHYDPSASSIDGSALTPTVSSGGTAYGIVALDVDSRRHIKSLTVKSLGTTDVANAESTANKVTAFSSTLSDVKYPSEKLVKNTIDNAVTTLNTSISAKADKVSNATNGHVAALDSSGNLTDSGYTLGLNVPSTTSGNVLGTTEVYHYNPATADGSNLAPTVDVGGTAYGIISVEVDSRKHIKSYTVKTLQTSDITNAENTVNKVTSLSSDSSNTQYPSAKLVYDQLLTKASTAVATSSTNGLMSAADKALIDSSLYWETAS